MRPLPRCETGNRGRMVTINKGKRVKNGKPRVKQTKRSTAITCPLMKNILYTQQKVHVSIQVNESAIFPTAELSLSHEAA